MSYTVYLFIQPYNPVKFFSVALDRQMYPQINDLFLGAQTLKTASFSGNFFNLNTGWNSGLIVMQIYLLIFLFSIWHVCISVLFWSIFLCIQVLDWSLPNNESWNLLFVPGKKSFSLEFFSCAFNEVTVKFISKAYIVLSAFSGFGMF